MAGAWEHFDHRADIGVRGTGDSMAEAFANAALALTAVVTDPALVAPRAAVRVRCEAPDPELLLVDWLNALVFEMARRRMLFREFAVAIDGPRLRAVLKGDKINVERHRPAVEVKGATYSQLRVARDPDGRWTAQCVVDV